MTAPVKDQSTTHILSLPQELVLMLLNEENGYFHQVPGWTLNCAVIGSILAELSLLSRIDTDDEALFVLDPTDTGNPVLDPILQEVAGEPARRNARYWIERLAPRAEPAIDLILDRLVELEILEKHSGDFWTVSSTAWHSKVINSPSEGTAVDFVKTRISKDIFGNDIPAPRDVIIICLINVCDAFRFIFQLDEESEERIELICKMDLIGRSIADAVSHNLSVPRRRHSALGREIPTVSLRTLLFNSHLRNGNMSALFAELARQHGPVFELRPPFRDPLTVLAGPETNHWAQRQGRLHLRAGDYLQDFEKVYGASGVLPSLDGADHFRLRKSLSSAYSRSRVVGQLDDVYRNVRKQMSDWRVGSSIQATEMCRRLVNEQLSPLMISVQSQDLIDDLTKYKERALTTHVVKVLPKFMLNTPAMRRRAKSIDTLVERVQRVHTPAQRAGAPRDIADDLLSLNASDPQFFPEANLRFALSAPLIASVYLGDALSFAVYALASQPELYERIRVEADALFEEGDPSGEDFTLDNIDITHRFLMESLRLYPIVPVSMRTVVNGCIVEDYELRVGAHLAIAQTATHFMEELFPDPFSFDIDRYLPPRNEHHSTAYAPYGLGTHTCLGSRWMELQLAVNVLMIAHYFTLKVSPANYKLRCNAFPSMKPDKKLRFAIAEQRRELRV